MADLHPLERSFVRVLHDIVSQLHRIVRCELRLAKTEFGEELRRALKAALVCGVAGFVCLLAIIFLFLAVQFALARVIPDWAAAIVISGSLAIFATLEFMAGIKRFKRVDSRMPITMESLKENTEWAKRQIK